MSIINYEDDMLPGVTCRLYGFGIPLQVNIHNTYWRFGGGQLDAGESENIACCSEACKLFFWVEQTSKTWLKAPN